MAEPHVRVGVGVLITRGDRLLLMKRSGSHGADTWSPPGGHLDFGETPEQCGIREVYEEVGLRLPALRFRAITNDFFVEEHRHYITIWMEAPLLAGEPVIASAREMSALDWFDWANLPQPLFLPLAHLLAGQSYPPLPTADASSML